MRISAAEAQKYFEHPSQQLGGLDPKDLPDAGFHYFASDLICGVFHLVSDPGIFMSHYGAIPEGWGSLASPAVSILYEAWSELDAQRFIGWTEMNNKAALAFAKRLGFVIDGGMPLKDKVMVMQGWTP